MQRVGSREFQRNFGHFQDEALRPPLSITRNGRDRLVLISVAEYERLKSRGRLALAVEKLSGSRTIFTPLKGTALPWDGLVLPL